MTGLSKDPEKRKRQLDNLKKGTRFTVETARKVGRNGGLATAAMHSSQERLRRWYEMPVEETYFDEKSNSEKKKPKESVLYPGEVMQNGERMDMLQIKMAREGNLEAIKYIERKLGMAPSENMNVNLSGGISTSNEIRIGFDDDED